MIENHQEVQKLFGYEISEKMVDYFEGVATEQKALGDGLKNVPVAAVAFMMGLYLVLIVSSFYVNTDPYAEAKCLVKNLYNYRSEIEEKANDEKFKLYAIVAQIIRKGCIGAS